MSNTTDRDKAAIKVINPAQYRTCAQLLDLCEARGAHGVTPDELQGQAERDAMVWLCETMTVDWSEETGKWTYTPDGEHFGVRVDGRIVMDGFASKDEANDWMNHSDHADNETADVVKLPGPCPAPYSGEGSI